eukprot:5927268-Alexandrium_andersonii.AAC.1
MRIVLWPSLAHRCHRDRDWLDRPLTIHVQEVQDEGGQVPTGVSDVAAKGIAMIVPLPANARD